MHSSKKLWGFINEKINISKRAKPELISLVSNRREIVDPEEIANHSNEFFSFVGRNLASSIEPVDQLRPRAGRKTIDRSIFPRIFLTPASEREILSIISRLNAGNSCGVDTISVAVPVFEAGSRCESTNYRPIPLISNLTMVNERILKTRLLDFPYRKIFFSEYQCGFRSNILVSYLNRYFDELCRYEQAVHLKWKE